MGSPCEGCGKPLGLGPWAVCMDCTRARARAATSGWRCRCGNRRREGAERSIGGRRWVPCLRCLGTVRQLA